MNLFPNKRKAQTVYDLISGDVDAILSGAYDIVGAAPYNPYAMARPQMQNPLAALANQRQLALSNPAVQAMAAQKMMQQGALLRTLNPTKARRQFLGMESTGTVATTASATITSRPQSFAFKPERLFVPATIGPDFVITDIKVGNVSQLVQSGNLPAEAFSQTSFGIEMDFDTVQTSQDFIVQVTNISGGARTFRALVLGRAANG